MSDDVSAAPSESLPDAFIGHLGHGRFHLLAELFEPDVILEALLPDGLHTWQGQERVVAAFVRWFGRVDECRLEAEATHVGPRLQLHWRATVRGGGFGESWFAVEQHVYADPGPSGRIQRMAMLCSGFVMVREVVSR